MSPDLAALAREIIDSNLYMVLGTSGADGRPWVSPVYFAHGDYQQFYWVSRPARDHSRNIAASPEVSIAIFDSTQLIGTGNAVYVKGSAVQVEGDDRAEAIDLYSRRAISHGGAPWTVESVEPPAALRLYRASMGDMYVLDPDTDDRVPVAPFPTP